MTLKQLILLICVVVVATVVTIGYLRPELVPHDQLGKVAEKAKAYFSLMKSWKDDAGKTTDRDEMGTERAEPEHRAFTAEDLDKAAKEVLARKKREVENDKSRKAAETEEILSDSQPPPGKKYLYEIEFKSGGQVAAEKIRVDNGVLTYESTGGLVVSIPSHEVKTLQRIIITLPTPEKAEEKK
jgi:hypothetical protein